MYDSRTVIGDFFEEKVSQIFDLIKTSDKKLPDRISRNGSFYVEIKASGYDNGGVINQLQLLRFNNHINIRRFYALPYHQFSRHQCISEIFPTKQELIENLQLKSLYLFPFSIIKAYYETSKKRVHPKHDTFVQLDEKKSRNIFYFDLEIWEQLKLAQEEYKIIVPNEKIHIMTRQGNLEKEILDSFHPEFI